MNKLVFMNGYFLEEGLRLNLNPKNGMTTNFYVTHGPCFFSGTILLHDDGAFEGLVSDLCGYADLEDGRIEGTDLYFRKKYRHRSDIIEYQLVRKDGGDIFIGEYTGGLVGTGRCCLSLRDSPQGFLTALE